MFFINTVALPFPAIFPPPEPSHTFKTTFHFCPEVGLLEVVTEHIWSRLSQHFFLLHLLLAPNYVTMFWSTSGKQTNKQANICKLLQNSGAKEKEKNRSQIFLGMLLNHRILKPLGLERLLSSTSPIINPSPPHH